MVYIMTPYLIIDDETAMAFSMGGQARRGQCGHDHAHIPDKKYAFMLARGYISGSLLALGVRFMNTRRALSIPKRSSATEKGSLWTIKHGVSGAIFLHFECGVYLYKMRTYPGYPQDFDADT